MLIAVLPLLASCGKNVEVAQEVELPESGKKVTLRRTEIFAPRWSEFSFKKVYSRSELSIVNGDVPTWKQSVIPLYFGELRGEPAYVLVAVVPDALDCAKAGKLASPYVVFSAVKEKWHEIPMPAYLDGRSANLALIGQDLPLENGRIVSKIDLSAKPVC